MKKVNWLSDATMLPSSLPRARIMTYGYQSYWFGDDAVRISIEGVATSLLQDLDEKRFDCQDRPLLLVGHCFGGLVMQKVRECLSIHVALQTNANSRPTHWRVCTGTTILEY